MLPGSGRDGSALRSGKPERSREIEKQRSGVAPAKGQLEPLPIERAALSKPTTPLSWDGPTARVVWPLYV